MKLTINLAKGLKITHRLIKEKEVDQKNFHYESVKRHTLLSLRTSTSPI
jgi:hypothetical protein